MGNLVLLSGESTTVKVNYLPDYPVSPSVVDIFIIKSSVVATKSLLASCYWYSYSINALLLV